MALNPDEDTEFNDALRKHGILPPREAAPPSPPPPPSPTLDDLLEDFTPEELRELGEDAKDDDAERTIEQYRRQRVAEQRRQNKARFGRIYPIGREDYTQEVTEASKINADEDSETKGTGVVCFLYKDGIPRSDRTFEQLRVLAQRFPNTKFVSIVGDKCIPNFPETRIPMLIIYKNGDIQNQIIAWGADRERSPEELEAVLVLAGAIIPPKRGPLGEDKSRSDSDEDDDSDGGPPSRSAATKTNGRTAKNVRSSTKKADDDDSDFEFDL